MVPRTLRRNRRDPRALEFALALARTSAALALSLIGLAGAAGAEAPIDRIFVSRPDANPLAGFQPLSSPRTAIADVDADGDTDVIAGGHLSAGLPRALGLVLFENRGTPASPSFVGVIGGTLLDSGAQTPAPALADLDADGDLDAVLSIGGSPNVTPLYFENTGSAQNPSYLEQTAGANPFPTFSVTTDAAFAFGDFDADGDLDCVEGDSTGLLHYFENTGSALTPAFVMRSGAENPFATEDLGSSSVPSVGDLDGDGDLDVVGGHDNGRLAYLKNSGTPTAPAFVRINTGPASPVSSFDFGTDSEPALGDLDADGDFDLIGGDDTQALRFLENTGSPTAPAFVERTGAAHPLTNTFRGADPVYSFADLDADGDLDAVAGDAGRLSYLENTGTASAPGFLQPAGFGLPIDGAASADLPALADLDADGDADLVSGSRYFENTGTPLAPAFVERTGAQNPAAAFPNCAFVLVDLDADGDRDAAGAEYPACPIARTFENIGIASSPAFVELTESANPLGSISTQAIALGDVDGDGDVDALSSLRFYENTGTASTPAFDERHGEGSPMPRFTGSSWLRLALADLDADGRPELFSAAPDSHFVLQNLPAAFQARANLPVQFPGLAASLAAAPAVEPVFGVAIVILGADDGQFRRFVPSGTGYVEDIATNPLAGADVGDRSVPALAHLDGPTEEVDLLSGRTDGTLAYFRKPPSSTVFSEQTGAQNPFAAIDVGERSAPAIGGGIIPSTGNFVVGAANGTLRVYLLSTSFPALPLPLLVATPLDALDFGDDAKPALADLDSDGDTDIVVGNAEGALAYIENLSVGSNLAFAVLSGADNPLDGIDVGSGAAPVFSNLDYDDGVGLLDDDLDLLVGNEAGQVLVLENVGDRFAATFAAPEGERNPLAPMARDWLRFGDLDADGDPDAIGVGFFGLTFFENTGTRAAPAFFEHTTAPNPLTGIFQQGPSELVDLDSDGDLDAANMLSGVFNYFENTGSPTTPAFVWRSGSASPFAGLSAPGDPAFGDFDGDGDLDLVAGGFDKTQHYYENTGTPAAPHFVERTGAQNPFAGLAPGNVFNEAESFVVDLDRDGDLDVFAIRSSSHAYFENTGTASTPAFRPGASPLFWLGAIGPFVDLDGDGDADSVSASAFIENTTPISPTVRVPAWTLPGALAGLCAGAWRVLRRLRRKEARSA